MERDQIYADTPEQGESDGPFEFSASVARVFPDMLRRSIPGYATSIQAIQSLARRHVQADSRCYDLGCSLGAATLAIRHGIAATGCKIIAVDNAPAMVTRCRELLARDEGTVPVELVCADARDVEIADASMVVMNYTLQFLAPRDRPGMMERIADGMRSDGVFVLSEKVVHDDPAVESALVELHHEFKRQNAYSELEISRKRAALENVLIPDSVATHETRLKKAGFRHVGVWLRHFNFVSLIAIR